MSAIELTQGDLTLTVLPELGGAVTALKKGSVDLLRPASQTAIATHNALDSACYPLVPFSNRIADGKLLFQGAEYRMAPNMPPHPHPLHGHGFRGQWAVEGTSSSSVALSFDYEGSDFPAAYAATQHIVLSQSALSMELAVKNTGKQPMPAGLGLHPFFVKPKGTTLMATLGGVWLSKNNDGIPTEHVVVPEQWDFAEPRDVADVVLDNCFTGWVEKVATIAWPTLKLRARLSAEGPCDYLVIYIPQGQDFFCVEPVTNMNDAFNRFAAGATDTGTQVLTPGEELKMKMVVAFEPLE